MSDHYEGFIRADELTEQPLTVDHFEEHDAQFDSLTESDAVINEVHVDNTRQRPEWSLGESRLGTDPRLPRVVNKGAEVEYVNHVLGVDSDTYNMDSANALTKYLKANDLPRQRVTKALYENM